MVSKFEKPLHVGNIAAAIGIAATATDVTLFGGAGAAITVALSSLSIFSQSDKPTQDIANTMAPILSKTLNKSALSKDQQKIVLQLLQDHPPSVADIAEASHDAARTAERMREKIENTVTDPAQKLPQVLATYQTVLAAALKPIVEPEDQASADAAEILKRLDDTGGSKRMLDEGITEKAVIRLANRVTRDTSDLNAAWTTIEDAIDVAIRVQREGQAPSNHRTFVDDVLARTAALAAQGEYTAALESVNEALAEADAQKQRLLKRGVDMARLAGDAPQAAEMLMQQLHLDAPTDMFNALRALQDAWYVQGRDQGVAFDAQVAIDLAQRSVAMASDANERGAALNDLGTALQTLGARDSDTARLQEAVTAFQNALLEWTRKDVPLDWAMTQNNLGAALQTLGERDSGTARLQEAVTAYENALLEWTREDVPLDWAMTQNNLGNALAILGGRNSDTARLQEAVTAYQNALLERTREKVPLNWATTQNNLGNALQTLGARDSDTARLQEAVTAYQNALLERTREKVPLNWATTQNNLGNALQTLGARDSDTARLQEAVTAYQNALLERTREKVPLNWATTQNNLGNALATLGERDSDTARLQEAVTAFQNALLEWTREKVPLDWAMTQHNLAIVEIAFFDIDGDAVHLDAAQTHAQAAREVFEQAGASHYLEKADRQIANIQSRQG